MKTKFAALLLALSMAGLPHLAWASDAVNQSFNARSVTGSYAQLALDIPTLTANSTATGTGFVFLNAVDNPFGSLYFSNFTVNTFKGSTSFTTPEPSSVSVLFQSGSTNADLFLVCGASGQVLDVGITLTTPAPSSALGTVFEYLGTTDTSC